MGTNLYFMGYLIVSSIQMGANIDYAIVIATRFNELKDKMEHKQAMIETINFAFPTILTSGTIMTVSGILIGQMTSDACIVGIGQCLGRGTIISIILVLFVLPQILLIGTRIVDRTSFAVPKLVARSRRMSGFSRRSFASSTFMRCPPLRSVTSWCSPSSKSQIGRAHV